MGLRHICESVAERKRCSAYKMCGRACVMRCEDLKSYRRRHRLELQPRGSGNRRLRRGLHSNQVSLAAPTSADHRPRPPTTPSHHSLCMAVMLPSASVAHVSTMIYCFTRRCHIVVDDHWFSLARLSYSISPSLLFEVPLASFTFFLNFSVRYD